MLMVLNFILEWIKFLFLKFLIKNSSIAENNFKHPIFCSSRGKRRNAA
jgi:hypothetical protein